MNIKDMHNTFRTLGQKMGLQLVRGILPESIDVYLNDAITEIVRQYLLLTTKNEIDNGRISKSDINSKVSTMTAINAFRTLFRRNVFSIDINNINDNSKIYYFDKNNGEYGINIPIINSNISIESNEEYLNPVMMYLDIAVSYENNKFYNCRIIPTDFLEETLNDYCNAASKDYPIANLDSIGNYNNESDNLKYKERLRIFTETKSVINNISISYIKLPNKVKFNVNDNMCVNCDLPDYYHYTIVENAVSKFQSSIEMGNYPPQ